MKNIRLGDIKIREVINQVAGTTLPISQIISNMPHEERVLWNKLNKRRYKNVERFHDYRMACISDISAFMKIKAMGPAAAAKDDEAMANLCVTLLARAHDFPLFFAATPLVQAAMATTCPDHVDWEFMKLPFPVMRFVLPKGLMYIGQEAVSYLEMARLLPEDDVLNVPFPTLVGRPILRCTALSVSGVSFHVAYTSPNIQRAMECPTATGLFYDSLNVDERIATKMFTGVMFNLLFAMAARPEYVEAGRKVKIHKKTGQELWEPNIIGRKYAIKKDASLTQGSHASPRMHWRRGHFRQQPYGPGRQEYKTIWLEPVLVALKSDEEGETHVTN